MIGSVLIEPAIIGDASAIAALDRTVLDGGWEASAVASLIQDPTAICRVARSGSRTAGFALCRLASDECEVLSCAVDAEFRRSGRLACFSRRRSTRRFVGADAASSWKWRKITRPRGLYSGLGFDIVGRRPRYYRRRGGETVDALIADRVL